MEGVCPLVEHPLLQSKLCHVHDWTGTIYANIPLGRVEYLVYMSVCRMSVVCQINCVGGITYSPRACSKSFLAVKPVTTVLFISYTLEL